MAVVTTYGYDVEIVSKNTPRSLFWARAEARSAAGY